MRLLPTIAVLLFACSPKPRETDAKDRMDDGFTAILVGIFGNAKAYNTMHETLIEGGVPGGVGVVDWTLGKSMFLLNMRASGRNRKEAAKFAQEIVDYQDEYPGRPSVLICHSGGCGFCIMILKSLPENRKVTAVVMLAPAVSPYEDLTVSLRHVERGILVCYSEADVFYLGAGTAIIGTYDGPISDAAGLHGFKRPADLSEEGKRLYDTKLRQVPWTVEMREIGHGGGHWGYFAPEYVRKKILPPLRELIRTSRSAPG